MPEEGQVEASIGPPIEPDYLRPVYANQINVNFTPHDFRFTFSLIEIPLSPPEEGQDRVVLRPTAVANVIVPATVMHAYIALLQAQFGNYLQQFGPPGLDPAGPGGQQ